MGGNMLEIIEDGELITANQKLLENIKDLPEFEAIKNVVIGYQGENCEAEVYYSEKFDIWAYFDELDNRYWNVFGVGRPVPNKNVSITCEINIPLKGYNRRIAGVFAKDERGNIFLLHNGKIGGGRLGVGRELFKKCFSGEWKSALSSEGEMEFAVVGELKSYIFVEKLSEFIKEIKRVKDMRQM